MDRWKGSLPSTVESKIVYYGGEFPGTEYVLAGGRVRVDHFEFTDVFRKDQGGTWRYSTVTFNMNEPG